jgi:hypothetical protein
MNVIVNRAVGPLCLAVAAYMLCDYLHMPLRDAIVASVLVFLGFACMGSF